MEQYRRNMNYRSNPQQYSQSNVMPVNEDMMGMSPGMCYVPRQQWRKIYQAEEGFDKGTIFAELDFVFKYGRCARR